MSNLYTWMSRFPISNLRKWTQNLFKQIHLKALKETHPLLDSVENYTSLRRNYTCIVIELNCIWKLQNECLIHLNQVTTIMCQRTMFHNDENRKWNNAFVQNYNFSCMETTCTERDYICLSWETCMSNMDITIVCTDLIL